MSGFRKLTMQDIDPINLNRPYLPKKLTISLNMSDTHVYVLVVILYLSTMVCIFLPCSVNASVPQENMSLSMISSQIGHYPFYYCHITNVVLKPTKQTFYLNYKNFIDVKEKCQYVSDMWNIASQEEFVLNDCDEIYDEGHVFAVYYHYNSNYFHLHYDMMLPLYKALHWKESNFGKRVLLMPSVETARLKAIDWNTPAFRDDSKYWVNIIQTIAATYDMKPLDETLIKARQNICFKDLYLGTQNVDFSDSDLVKNFVHFVWSELGVEPSPSFLKEEFVGIISRSNRRRILNEKELVHSVQEKLEVKAELVKFEEMSYKEQVAEVQKYTVLVGMNGAGLMNAIYLPPHAVAVQLVPYNASVNNVKFGILLKSRGPYLEWHNTHRSLHHPLQHDPYNNKPDTTVHIEEFVSLVEQALNLAREASLAKEEL